MKKVTNITLGGVVFAIEDDAFTTLGVYLHSIEEACKHTGDYAEIASDVEGAIAEKFSHAGKSEKIAVTSTDVETVIKEMGSAEDFAEESGAETATTFESQESAKQTTQKRRLYRNEEDVILAGVASGIATYFDIDPVIVRILFIIFAFFNGIGILVYIILWLVVPVAQTTAQKYAMRGEKVTLSHITKRVKKNLSDIDTEVLRAQKAWTPLRDFLEKILEVLGVIIKAVAVVVRYCIGIGLVLFGVFGLAGLTSAFAVALFSEKTYLLQELQIPFEMFISDTIGLVALGALYVALVIPLFFCVILGAGLCAKRSLLTVSKIIVLGTIWVIAGTVAATTVTLQTEKVVEQLHVLCEEGACETKAPISSEAVEAFSFALQQEVVGMPIEGYEPFMFMEVFPGLTESDFEGVSAYNGHYTVENGTLVHKIHNPDVMSSADNAITERGMRILLENVAARLDIDLTQERALTNILDSLTRAPQEQPLEQI